MKLRELLKHAEVLCRLLVGHITIVPKNYEEDWRGFTIDYRKESEFEWDPVGTWIEYWEDSGEDTGLKIPEDTDMWHIETFDPCSIDVYIDLNSEDWIILPGSLEAVEEELAKVQNSFNAVNDVVLN